MPGLDIPHNFLVYLKRVLARLLQKVHIGYGADFTAAVSSGGLGGLGSEGAP